MSLFPMIKKCPKCKRRYDVHLDVGIGLICPYCGETVLLPKSTLKGRCRLLLKVFKINAKKHKNYAKATKEELILYE